MEREVNWQDAVVDCAQRFSQKMENAFVEEVRLAERFLPSLMLAGEEKKSGREFSIECFLDYLVGTAVAIAATYYGNEEAHEENFIEVVRDKFRRIREMKKGEENVAKPN